MLGKTWNFRSWNQTQKWKSDVKGSCRRLYICISHASLAWKLIWWTPKTDTLTYQMSNIWAGHEKPKIPEAHGVTRVRDTEPPQNCGKQKDFGTRVMAMEFCLILRMTCRCCNLLFAEGEFAMVFGFRHRREEAFNKAKSGGDDDDDKDEDDGQPFPILLAHVFWMYHEVNSNKKRFFLLPLRPWPSHLSLQPWLDSSLNFGKCLQFANLL